MSYLFLSCTEDKNSSLTPWEQARSNNVKGFKGEDALGLSVGMRYDF